MSTVLYVVAHRVNGVSRAPVKVGISTQPDGRLAQLQTGNPWKLGFLWTFDLPDRAVALAAERQFHSELGPERMSGEWFNVAPQRAIDVICAALRLRFRSAPDPKFRLMLAGVTGAEMQYPLRRVADLARA